MMPEAAICVFNHKGISGTSANLRFGFPNRFQTVPSNIRPSENQLAKRCFTITNHSGEFWYEITRSCCRNR
ncbi:hypothetical protein, partial [Neisseria dentiae]|uniref:hypothetical protein n=1 Tax=Neisseria dentiae TaxID=194197 RepID=UPI00359FC18F